MPISDPAKSNIQYLKGIGARRAALFAKLGIHTVGELLHYYPRDYQDYSSPVSIASAPVGETCCILATVTTPVRQAVIRRGMTLYKIRIMDDTGRCDLTFFNNKYIPEMIQQGEKYLFYGRMGGNPYRKSMASPDFEKAGKAAGLRPLYPATEGLPSRTIAAAVKQALTLVPEPSDPLPDSLRNQYKLCHLGFAVENIHFPKTICELATARRRFVFEELLALRLGMSLIRRQSARSKGFACDLHPDFTPFLKSLPFSLTGAQKRAVSQGVADMARGFPMNRLIEGDVGSGKTAVAAALCYNAHRNGLQSALMAPTEILAAQHFHNLTRLLSKCGVNVGLLTGGLSAGEKKRVKKMLCAGELDLVVGTHALVQEDVEFTNLGLVITDEQHRFGVEQRARLAEKGGKDGVSPHMLIMSATPIPRTLALIIYGELDVSVLDELPTGRQKIKTYLVDPSLRPRIYSFIRRLVAKGRQAYIVCPLVDEGDQVLSAAESYAQKVSREDFAGLRVGLLHGRLKGREKEDIMRRFASGELDILVATTVIEVGVDVPNAVVMMVENAERFGLSQLHQLRGRVGRGKEQSYCILVSDAQGGDTRKRLEALCKTEDGFQIAEKDLQLRGPGDFFGHRQHGLPQLHIADLFSDMEILGEASQCAKELLKTDPDLKKPEHRGIRALVSALFGKENVIFN